ncbi:MAG: 3-deoxy-8-phosphooctulonate synthase [Planctomycetia bacterium]|nr:3-deoxy-8-phosphooctulonate synthase [Planctomycetia bacterium]
MLPTQQIPIGFHVTIGGNQPFTWIAGPCAMENESQVWTTAEELKRLSEKWGISLIFKSSFDKANRSSIHSPRGMGMEAGLKLLAKIREELQIPVTTDVHESWQCSEVGEVVDVLQIPAFLARQTDLLVAAARTGKVVNVKKGQFMAPDDMHQVVGKLLECGNAKILLCERGSCFGYHQLVVDMTSLVEMRKEGFPIVFDATHSVQKPGGNGTSTGGNREHVPYLMNAAAAIGVDAIFTEVHPDPDQAISDAANQLPLSQVETILAQAIRFDQIAKSALVLERNMP